MKIRSILAAEIQRHYLVILSQEFCYVRKEQSGEEPGFHLRKRASYRSQMYRYKARRVSRPEALHDCQTIFHLSFAGFKFEVQRSNPEGFQKVAGGRSEAKTTG